MAEPQLTAGQARAALDEAGMRAAQIRRNDRQLSWILFVVLALYLGVGAVMSISPHQGRTSAGLAVILIVVIAIAAAVVIGLRIRAYSRAGVIWYFLTMIGFNLWNSAVASASIGTRFWALGEPSYHFGISVLVAIIPLVIGAIALWRRS